VSIDTQVQRDFVAAFLQKHAISRSEMFLDKMESNYGKFRHFPLRGNARKKYIQKIIAHSAQKTFNRKWKWICYNFLSDTRHLKPISDPQSGSVNFFLWGSWKIYVVLELYNLKVFLRKIFKFSFMSCNCYQSILSHLEVLERHQESNFPIRIQLIISSSSSLPSAFESKQHFLIGNEI
jgi:hypothetical protein